MSDLLLECRNVSIQYLENTLVKFKELNIYRGNRIGLVAPNGKGKTATLNFLAGITNHKGVRHAFGSISLCKQQKGPPLEEISGNKNMRGESNYREISGGELAKLRFVEALRKNADILLLDEPSAHMDSGGIDFIIKSLNFYYGSFVIVSHDRFLLNQLVDIIWEIEDGGIKFYKGNYDQYIKRKQEKHEQVYKEYEDIQNEKKRLQIALHEKKKQAAKVDNTKGIREYRSIPSTQTKAKQTSAKGLNKAAKNIERRIEKLQEVTLPTVQQPIQFETGKQKKIHKRYPIMVDYIDISKGGSPLIEQVSLQVPLGSVLSVTGLNGTGKSALLETIYYELRGVVLSKKAQIGYFNQKSVYHLHNKDITLLEYCKAKNTYDEIFLYTVLDKINFRNNDLKKKLNQLSGGELTRLSLLLLFIQDFNILLLDEPDNFLDIVTINVLEEFVMQFPGTILCVSHDKQFTEKISDEIYEIKDKTLVKVK